MPDIRTLLISGLIVCVPVFLTVWEKRTWLVQWIVLTSVVDLFDTKLLVNLPAARVAGLLLLPLELRRLRGSRSAALNTLWYRVAHLACLGLYFGFLFPWPSVGGWGRALNHAAQGRTVVYMLRAVSDVGVALCVASYISTMREPRHVLRWIALGAGIAGIGAIVAKLLNVDLFGVITGLRTSSYSLGTRIRGINYEPRGLGLAMAYGLCATFILLRERRSWVYLGLLLIQLVAIVVSVSTSGMLCLVAGLAGMALFDSGMRRPVLAGMAALGVVVGLFLASGGANPEVGSWQRNVELRLTPERFSTPPRNWAESLAYRMDGFDSGPLLFLVAHPIYAVTGTGPGLVTLPGTAYVPKSPFLDYIYANPEDSGLNVPPTIGVLLELCNGGVLGLVLCGVFLAVSAGGLKRRVALDPARWEPARAMFFAGMSIYAVQTGTVTPIWAVAAGIGLAATISSAPAPVPAPADGRAQGARIARRHLAAALNRRRLEQQ